MITGDIHASVIGDLAVGDAVMGTELVGPSITSRFPANRAARSTRCPVARRRVRFADAIQHGYVVVQVTPDECRADYHAVASVAESASSITTASSWIIENGRPGARPA